MKKEELIKELINFIGFEEEITIDLVKNYLKKVENSELTKEEKKEIKKRLSVLMKETEEHTEKFTKLLENVKKSKKREF